MLENNDYFDFEGPLHILTYSKYFFLIEFCIQHTGKYKNSPTPIRSMKRSLIQPTLMPKECFSKKRKNHIYKERNREKETKSLMRALAVRRWTNWLMEKKTFILYKKVQTSVWNYQIKNLKIAHKRILQRGHCSVFVCLFCSLIKGYSWEQKW